MQSHCEASHSESQYSSVQECAKTSEDPTYDHLTSCPPSSAISPSNPNKSGQEMQTNDRLAKKPSKNTDFYTYATAHFGKVMKRDVVNTSTLFCSLMTRVEKSYRSLHQEPMNQTRILCQPLEARKSQKQKWKELVMTTPATVDRQMCMIICSA